MKYEKLKELVDKIPHIKTCKAFWSLQDEIKEILNSMSFNDTRTPIVQQQLSAKAKASTLPDGNVR